MGRYKRSRVVRAGVSMFDSAGSPIRPSKVRPRHRRCPECRKIRLWWPRANAMRGKTGPGNVEGRRVCWLCVQRYAARQGE